MRCVIAALVLTLLGLAQARAAEPSFEWDELSRGILCFGTLRVMNDRITSNVVRVFASPEKDASGAKKMRLYVGYIEDPDSAGKAQAFYKGPLAESWESPRLPPGMEKIRVVKRPLRYWIDRIEQGPDGSEQTATAEIDLEAKTPVVRTLVRLPGKAPQERLDPLQSLPLTPSSRMLIRSGTYPTVRTNVLQLRPVSVHLEGDYTTSIAVSAKRPNPWNPAFFAVSTRDGSRCAIQTLPKAGFWGLEKVLSLPALDDVNGTFLVEMMEDYLPPDARTPNDLYHRRVSVRVGLDHLSSEILEDSLLFDFEQNLYYKAPPRKEHDK